MNGQNNFKKLPIALLLLATFVLPSVAIAQEEDPAHLHIWADVGYYVDSDPNAWIYQGWWVPACTFNLNIYNKNQNPAYDVYLAVAVTDPTKITSIAIGSTTLYPGDFTYGATTWPNAAGGGTISPHGVYPTWYALVYFGDIGGNREWRTVPGDPYGPYDAYLASTAVTIVATGGVMVHFDAQGVLVRGSTSPGDIVSNPFSHDLTSMCMGTPPTATISGLKFHDRNADGVKDTTEEGLKDWAIQLWKYVLDPDPNWIKVDATATGNDGTYTFTVNEAGTYRVCEVLEPGWMQTAPPTGCHEVNVELGHNYTDVDFGNVALSSICGHKFHDRDADGVKDPMEEPLKDWTIQLWKIVNGVWVKDVNTTTSDDGSYCFTDLRPGTYKVTEVTQSGWMQTAPPIGCHEFDVEMGNDYIDVDFGNIELGSISGYKLWAALDPNDIDPCYPLENWELHLTGKDILGNLVDATEFTNILGRFTFANLLPGTYKVQEVFPPPPAVWVPKTATSFTHTLCVGENYVGPTFVNMHKGPIVITDPATNIGETSATLNGYIGDDGGDTCKWRFNWWSADMFASCAMSGALTTGQSFQLDIDGLKPGTLYYFRAFARNSAAIVGGNIQSFTTLPPCDGTLLLIAPNGGEVLIAGSTCEITWQTTGPIANVLLEYSADNGSHWAAIGTVVNTGSYLWVVPDVNDSQQCLVRVSGEDCPGVNDSSDDVFTIYRCTLLYDLNHDCVVDQLDYDLLMSEWLKCGNPFDPNCVCAGDPNCPQP